MCILDTKKINSIQFFIYLTSIKYNFKTYLKSKMKKFWKKRDSP